MRLLAGETAALRSRPRPPPLDNRLFAPKRAAATPPLSLDNLDKLPLAGEHLDRLVRIGAPASAARRLGGVHDRSGQNRRPGRRDRTAAAGRPRRQLRPSPPAPERARGPCRGRSLLFLL